MKFSSPSRNSLGVSRVSTQEKTTEAWCSPIRAVAPNRLGAAATGAGPGGRLLFFVVLKQKNQDSPKVFL